MKKILFFVQSGVGGAERVSVTIGKNLDSSKYKVVFYAVGPWENKIRDFIPASLFRSHLKTANSIKLILEMKRVILEEQPDIVFSSVMNLNTKLLFLKKILFKKIRFIIRCDNNYPYFSFKQRMLIRATYNLSDTIIAQTEEMSKGFVLAGIHPQKIVVLHNPVDKERIDKAVDCVESPYKRNNCFHFVASGRFAEAKGFDILVEAFALLKKTKKDVDLCILGNTGGETNSVYQKIQHIIRKYGLEHDVHCVGFLNNPYPYIKHANAFVLSSRHEGLPNVLLEALYLKTPVVATKCIPIISRIVKENLNGTLADVDDINSLADAMEKVMALSFSGSDYQSATNSDFERIF